MNDNVGDMPIEIFGDYVSDMLDEEWNWIYCIPPLDEDYTYFDYGHGYNIVLDTEIVGFGHGVGWGAFDYGIGWAYTDPDAVGGCVEYNRYVLD